MSQNYKSPETPNMNRQNSGQTSQKSYAVPPYDADLLKRKGITIGKILNSGSFSTVCKADVKGKPTAVKIIDLTKTSDDYKNKFLPRELYSMLKLKHPNIVSIVNIFTLQDVRVYVFMEWADGGDLLDIIKDGPLTESKARPLYKGIADALRFIHEKGFAHRDIKCENILLNKEGTVAKIADFGFSRACFDNETGQRLLSKTYCGSAAYAAPEIIRVKPYNAMIADVWSMGVVLYVIVQNRLPFKDKNLRELLKMQLESKIEFPTVVSDVLKDLIRKHLEPDVKKRYTMAQLLKHKWLQ